MKRNVIKKQFNKLRPLLIKAKIEFDKFSDMVEEYYGAHYSDYDIDSIIDEMDYCPTNEDYSFEDFDREMKEGLEFAGFIIKE